MDEISTPVRLCGPDGRLNPDAVGYTRRGLHETQLPGWGRNKRWERWGIITGSHVIELGIANLDYVGILRIDAYDRTTGEQISQRALLPPGREMARAIQLPDSLPPFEARARGGKLKLSFKDAPSSTVLRFDSPRVGGHLTVPVGGDGLGVAVPFSAARFQYILKDLARPAWGMLSVDGHPITVAARESWAVLERGRGRLPYRERWNRGTGSGNVDGVRMGLALDGERTRATPTSENALVLDGRLHYLPAELNWTLNLADPAAEWRVQGPRVSAKLVPFHRRRARTNCGVLASNVYRAFGHWEGCAEDDDGAKHHFAGLAGWAERVSNRL